MSETNVNPLSADVIQTSDTANQIGRVAAEKALANSLTPVEIISIDQAARNEVYAAHRAANKSGLPDTSDVQRAGHAAVQAARQAKVAGNPVVVAQPSAPVARAPYEEQQRPSAAQTQHGVRVHAPEITAMISTIQRNWLALSPENQKAIGGQAELERQLRLAYEGTPVRKAGAAAPAMTVEQARAMIAAADAAPAEIQPSQVPAEHLHGYSLAAVPEGITIVDVGEMSRMLRRARAIGLSQAQVDAAIVAEANQ